MVAPRSRILDAGCGPGRVGAELAARGHVVVGVDVDPALIAAAESDHPGPLWLVADLAELDLAAAGHDEPFDAAVMAGNVMTFLAPGSEQAVLARVAAHLRPDGIMVVGFATDRGYLLSDFDRHVATSGVVLEHRFATWDLRPWSKEAAFAVSVLRRPPGETSLSVEPDNSAITRRGEKEKRSHVIDRHQAWCHDSRGDQSGDGSRHVAARREDSGERDERRGPAISCARLTKRYGDLEAARQGLDRL